MTRHRLERIASVIDKVPPDQRPVLLGREYSTFPRSGLSAEQWLRFQRQRLVFYGVLALLIATALLIAIALVEQSRRNEVVTKPVDWQMFLNLGAMTAENEGRKLWEMECEGGVASPPSLTLPHDKTITIVATILLVVDNEYRTHRGLVYPVGFSSTWDRSVHVVYDGLDVETQRSGDPSKFSRQLLYQVTLHTPQNSGQHYLVFLAGAALDARQLFAFRADAQETSQSFSGIFHILH